MKKLILFCLFLSTPSFAADYGCRAAADARRGFPIPLEVRISPDANGGNMYVLSQNRSRNVGRATAQTLAKNDQRTAALFKQVMAQLGTPALSGVKSPENVTTIIKYFASGQGDSDVAVFRFFMGPLQVGGTVVVEKYVTICAAKGIRI